MISAKKRAVRISAYVLIIIFAAAIVFAYTHYLEMKEVFIAEVSKRITERIGQEVHIGDVSFSFAGGLLLYDIRIANPEHFPPGTFLHIKNHSDRNTNLNETQTHLCQY